MSAIASFIKIEHMRLEAGEILILDGVIYLIESVERLLYAEPIALAANANQAITRLLQLRPEDDEVYHLEYMGISHEYFDAANAHQVFPSGTIFHLAYPRGDSRFTPHGLALEIDENMASRLDPLRIDLWIKPATEPYIVASNSLAQAINYQPWFYGWKYRTKVITKADLNAARARNVKILEIERYVAK